MAAHPSAVAALDALEPKELRALTEAAAWYAKYHERIISESADDPSASARVRREQFSSLHGALWKLGVEMRRPDGI
jgi:hypothetical protein